MLSRPILSSPAESYWTAFTALERDRDTFSHSLGMGGGILLSARLKSRAIRVEGHRRGYSGSDLEDFVTIIALWDSERVYRSNAQAVADVKAALARNSRPPRR